MLARLIVGIMKGLFVGGLIGFAFFKLGFVFFPLWLALLAAALTGVVIGLIAGKPIWAKDARIEAGVKAAVGALLGAGLMFGVRKWLPMPLPNALLESLGAMTKDVALGSFPITSLALVAALLGGFYDADNTPEPEGAAKKDAAPEGEGAKAGGQKRIAAPADEALDEELEDEADPKKAKK